jgi:predicted transcriptional regulator
MGARTEAQVVVFLKELEKDGYVECTGDQWRMTEAGFKALHEPLLDQHEQTPGPVEIGIGG